MNPLTNIKKYNNQENKNSNKINSLEFKIKEEERKYKYTFIKGIKEQKEQERNRSKKTKKIYENKNKNKVIKKIGPQKIKTNPKINTNKNNVNNNNDINEIEDYLKNKTNASLGIKNFLGSSINSTLMNEFQFKKTDLNQNNKFNKIPNNNKKEDIGIEKEDKFDLNLNNILIPMSNMKKENNCFLNVIIQVLFNLESFRIYILKYFQANYFNINDEVFNEFCNLINSYNSEQIKNQKNETPIEPILSVNLLRKKLNQKFGNYFKGECGDPMESLEHIFNSIHEEFNSENSNFIPKIKKGMGIGDCPVHQFFYLDLIENQICKNCGNFIKKHYDKNCYMFQIFISELSKRLTESNQSFENMHSKLFYQIKEQNEKYDISNTKIAGCKCQEKNNIKKLNLLRVNNSYVIINLTWSEEFPDLKEVLNIYTSLPLSDKNKHLFNVSEEKDQKILYIKSIILYGIYHYICVIYLTKFKKWGIIDDKNIKYIDKYYDLVEYLLRNHLTPVGLVYSYDKKDKIDELDIINNLLSKEKYLQILKFCKDVDNSKNIKMSYITKSKESLNEINENYLDNNLFNKSFIKQVIIDSNSSENIEDYKEKEKEKEENKNELKKSSLNKKSSEEENEKNSDNNDNIINIDKILKAKGKSIKNSLLFFDD